MSKIQEQEKEKAVESPTNKARAVVREIATAFRHVEDFEPFVKGIEVALGRAEFFDQAMISLYPRLEEGAQVEGRFPGGMLCLPVAGPGQVHGMVSFSNESRPFGPEDLHLMAGIGDLLGVLVEHALRFNEQRRSLALLDFLLNQAPVGAVCFDGDGKIVLANRLGKSWMGIKGSDWLPDSWMGRIAAAEENGGEFHCSMEGRLLHGQLRVVANDKTVKALVLSDLTGEIERWRDKFDREICRCGWLGEGFSLVTLTAPRASGLMEMLGSLRRALGDEALLGPVEAGCIALGFTGSALGEGMTRLRAAISSDCIGNVTIGGAELTGQIGEPEDLFAAARAASKPLKEGIQPRLLLHDGYSSVNDMLEMILGNDFQLLKSNRLNKTLALGEQRGFDGMISELELGNEAATIELVENVRKWNPTLRTFYTSCAPDRYENDIRLDNAVVFRKPFDVRDVESRVRMEFDR